MKNKSGKAPVKTRAAAAGVDKSMEISLAKISATFGRLRDDNIAAEHKVEDVNYACNAIRRFQEATAQLFDYQIEWEHYRLTEERCVRGHPSYPHDAEVLSSGSHSSKGPFCRGIESKPYRFVQQQLPTHFIKDYAVVAIMKVFMQWCCSRGRLRGS
ncbi:hypothetical protein F442_08906 [Phytophthora nicotianae P10297]|uniref:Uncharacterized protein n=1 Tax=Phytophthora nicotianae P10297 TaxID=1317064 RepID=W2ZE94_PHYNI|nr:hypothetical protein F442_08906 [Phytophthora nicotianae P10297]